MKLLRPRRIGNVYTFFNGRVVVGPDWHIMVVSVCLIVFGSLLFSCYTNTIGSARVVVGVFGGLAFALVLVCGMRDPGICPKELPPPIDAPPHDPLQVQVSYVNYSGTTGTTTVERKWCYSCNLYRPVRAVHCRFCDVCVCRRDHHCPWSGCCIGARNYLAYFCMVWCTLTLTLTVTISSIMSLAHRVDVINERQNAANLTGDARRNALGAAITETYCLELFLLGFSVLWDMMAGSLATYHLYLALNNKTSGDSSRHANDGENCYNRGSFLRNLKESFFTPASLMFEGGSLATHGDEWTVAIEAEEDTAPTVIPNRMIVTERSRRRDGGDVLARSLSNSAHRDEEDDEGNSEPNREGGGESAGKAALLV